MFPKIRGNGGISYWDSGKEAGIQGLRFPKIRGKVRVPIIGMKKVVHIGFPLFMETTALQYGNDHVCLKPLR